MFSDYNIGKKTFVRFVNSLAQLIETHIATVPRGPEVNMNTMTLKVKLKEALRIICIYFYVKYYTIIMYKPNRISMRGIGLP